MTTFTLPRIIDTRKLFVVYVSAYWVQIVYVYQGYLFSGDM